VRARGQRSGKHAFLGRAALVDTAGDSAVDAGVIVMADECGSFASADDARSGIGAYIRPVTEIGVGRRVGMRVGITWANAMIEVIPRCVTVSAQPGPAAGSREVRLRR